MDSLVLKSPAKINLFLEVEYLREDGYHEIETVMQTVSLFDTISFFKNDAGIEITSDAEWLPRGRDNLAYKAAESFFDKSGLKHGIKIHIAKKIPSGGGLGGGSSNAATMLKGLNFLYGEIFSADTLCQLASEIGSDVPFFIYGETALCKGRGDVVTPLDLPGLFYYVVVVPPIQASTRSIYLHLNKKRSYPGEPRGSYEIIQALREGLIQKIRSSIFNRLEQSAYECVEELGLFHELIKGLGGDRFFLTGSGAAFFKPVMNEQEGLEEVKGYRKNTHFTNCDIFLVKGNLRGLDHGNYRSEVDKN